MGDCKAFWIVVDQSLEVLDDLPPETSVPRLSASFLGIIGLSGTSCFQLIKGDRNLLAVDFDVESLAWGSGSSRASA